MTVKAIGNGTGTVADVDANALALRALQRPDTRYGSYAKKLTSGTVVSNQPRVGCTTPVTYSGQAHLQTDIENLGAAVKSASASEAFMTSISIANIEDWNVNQFYKTEDDYLTALADAMHVEYKAIVDAGFLLEEFARQVVDGAAAGRAIVHLAGLRLRQRYQLLQVVGGQARRGHQHDFVAGDGGHGGEVLHRVVGRGHQAGDDGVCDGGEEDGVAVRRRLHQRLGTDDGVATGAVVHQHLLAPGLG